MTPGHGWRMTHHRCRVHRGSSGMWLTGCLCGHAHIHPTWRRALIDALDHAKELI